MAIYGSNQHTSDESVVASFSVPVIKDKWKVFSIGQHFAHDPTDAEAVELFDALLTFEHSQDIEDFLDSHEEAYLWSPYVDMNSRDLVEEIKALARYAQSVEALP